MKRTQSIANAPNPTLTPKLRFPEFRTAPGWETEKLGDLFAQREETGYTNLRLLSLTDAEGIIPQEDSGRKNNASVDRSKYLRVVHGDIAYNTMRMWEGRSARATIEGLVSPAYTVCKPNDGTDSLFFSHYFKTQQLIEEFARYSQGLVKDTLNLKYEAFARIETATPRFPEQHKIASCLSSLDDLIAAERQKLDALKAHKKGLMQHLFPREGETRPRLRFPEFQNAGEWASEPLGELGEIVTGKTPSTKESDLWGGDILFITPTDISEDAKYQHTTARTVVETKSTKILPAGSVVYTCIASIGKMALTVHPSVTNQQINAVVPKEKALGEFIYYALANLTPWIKTIPASSTLAIINKTEFSKIAILHPRDKTEQNRIASCLTSLDDLIAAQAGKIEALKTHKNGLMQQLFPAPAEVAG